MLVLSVVFGSRLTIGPRQRKGEASTLEEAFYSASSTADSPWAFF